MKHLQKIMAVILAVLMMVTILPMSAFAAESNTAKEEVVYINLNTDGTVKEINVVNIFDLDKDGKIIDYGDYSKLRNMTTEDEIEYKDNTVTIDTKSGKLYYEGKLKNNVMPWNINIRYFMDGREYTAEKINGKSGKLEIRLSITKNPDCDSLFFEGYALQATVTLDSQIAAGIVADGATIANVGKNKQLTYTVLPNHEKDISVSADVIDFEMNAISINGVQMNMDVDVDDGVINDKVDALTEAMSDLNNGAGKLNDGAKDFHSATGGLNMAMEALQSGVGSVYNGASEIKNGLDTLASKNDDLTGAALSVYEGLCDTAEIQLNAILSKNGLGTVTLTPRNYNEVLSGLLSQMGETESAAQVSELKKKLDNYGAFYSGLVDYTNGVSFAANGAGQVTSGLNELYSNTEILSAAVEELHIAAGTLEESTGSLKDGTDEFADKTSDMGAEVSDGIEAIVSSLTGNDVRIKSFVSDKNTNIKSVQFVIQTEDIETDDSVEEAIEPEEQLNFWQKFIRLFGITT